MNKRKIAAVITDALGELVVVGEDELQNHLQKHYRGIPRDLILELIARVLKDPSEIYEEKKTHTHYMFYRLESGGYVVVVVKQNQDGAFFSAIYSTGKKIRNKHKGLRRIKL